MNMRTIDKAAAKVRRALKKQKVDPRGRVWIRRTDYFCELCVDLEYLDADERWAVKEVIGQIDECGEFTWDVM
jgi:hypothetical protein